MKPPSLDNLLKVDNLLIVYHGVPQSLLPGDIWGRNNERFQTTEEMAGPWNS